MKVNKETILLIIVIVLSVWNIFTIKGIKTDIKSYKEKINAIQKEIGSAQVVNKEIDNKVSEVKEILSSGMLTMDNAQILEMLKGKANN